jgi:hypothetical protein
MRNIIADAGLVMIAAGVCLLSFFGVPLVAELDRFGNLRGPEGEKMLNRILGYIALTLLAVGTAFQLSTPYPF